VRHRNHALRRRICICLSARAPCREGQCRRNRLRRSETNQWRRIVGCRASRSDYIPKPSPAAKRALEESKSCQDSCRIWASALDAAQIADDRTFFESGRTSCCCCALAGKCRTRWRRSNAQPSCLETPAWRSATALAANGRGPWGQQCGLARPSGAAPERRQTIAIIGYARACGSPQPTRSECHQRGEDLIERSTLPIWKTRLARTPISDPASARALDPQRRRYGSDAKYFGYCREAAQWTTQARVFTRRFAPKRWIMQRRSGPRAGPYRPVYAGATPRPYLPSTNIMADGGLSV